MTASPPRALVTGATGFVGGRLAALLGEHGWKVHAVRRAESSRPVPAGVEVHLHDGTTAHLIDLAATLRPDVAFHLASLFRAEHRPEDVVPLVEANVVFGAQLLEALDRAGCRRIVDAATGWQHYRGADYDPVGLYAATKQAFADILAYWVSARGFAAITLELNDTYGPGDPRPKLIPSLLRAAAAGRRMPLSAGEQRLDLVQVDDVAEAFALAGRRICGGSPATGRRETYAVSSGEAIPLREVVDRLRRACPVGARGSPWTTASLVWCAERCSGRCSSESGRCGWPAWWGSPSPWWCSRSSSGISNGRSSGPGCCSARPPSSFSSWTSVSNRS